MYDWYNTYMTITERVRELSLPFGEYVVVGGAMEAHGIRPAHDLDIVVTPKLFETLIQDGWPVCDCDGCKAEWKEGSTRRMLKKPGVDILSDYSWKHEYKADTDELIKNADVIEGIPFVQLSELLKWKKAATREKDLKDVALLEEYLKTH